MSFNTGENVGAYRVMEKLGRGGMATVFKAYHASLDRYVALKVLHPAFLEDPNFLARFQREARLVAKLEHTNIVPVYDFADHEEQPYLVMKYVEGETLKAHLNRDRLSVDQIWGVVDAVGAGLGYAHKEGILHRDIKPSNVIMATDGRIYLADFGLARIAQSGESTLSSDMIMGTPQYISPEQAKGEKNLDNGTDIYSFAVMLYEMVVGQVPFSSDTPFSIIHDHIYSPLPLPHLVNPNVPDEVERVLLKALSKERPDRYENVEALSIAFKQAWDDTDVDMADLTMTSPIRKPGPIDPLPTPAAPAIVPTASTVAPEAQAKTVAQEEKSAEAPPASAKTKVSEKPEKKKRNIWAFLAVGLLLIAAVLFALNALGQDDLLTSLEDTEQPPIEEVEAPPSNDLGEVPLPPVRGEQGTSPEIEEAREWVGGEPDEPYAHKALALALWDARQFKEAYEQLNEALDLAGDELDFYFDIGFEFMDRDAWQGAAQVFLQALIVTPENAPETQELRDLFHESLYRGAGMREISKFLPMEEIERIDPPMMTIAEARHALHHGDPEDARHLLEELNSMMPNMPEARLLEAEINLRTHNPDEARIQFETLTNDENIPAWIWMFANENLERMP